ncbi:MAG: hypothetical protein WBP85_00620 [Terracidiphilus sp.]
MRVNVYSEELTERVELKTKQAENTGARFYGLHFFLRSPKELHHGEQDDDTSAVVLWSETPERLLALLSKATQEVQGFIESR